MVLVERKGIEWTRDPEATVPVWGSDFTYGPDGKLYRNDDKPLQRY